MRHDPGQLVTAMHGHRGHVSSLAMAHDEFGFFSAGWDGNVFVSGSSSADRSSQCAHIRIHIHDSYNYIVIFGFSFGAN